MTGHLHLTWGNLSFHPEAKRALLGWGLVHLVLLGLALRFGARVEARRPLRQVTSAALSTLAFLLGMTELRSEIRLLDWLPGSAVELVLLCIAAGSLHRLAASPAGPALAACGIWLTRTGGMTYADGPFEGIGMIVTSTAYAAASTTLWPLALAAIVTWRTLRSRPRP